MALPESVGYRSIQIQPVALVPSRSARTFGHSLIYEAAMQFKFMSVMVEDQERALKFYTSVLGFQKMADISMGKYRWLTVTSPDGIEGVELVPEPLGFPPARTYQKALFEAGIPSAAFITRNIGAEFERLKSLGVRFRAEPKKMGAITAATFEDTCGNIINLVQPTA